MQKAGISQPQFFSSAAHLSPPTPHSKAPQGPCARCSLALGPDGFRCMGSQGPRSYTGLFFVDAFHQSAFHKNPSSLQSENVVQSLCLSHTSLLPACLLSKGNWCSGGSRYAYGWRIPFTENKKVVWILSCLVYWLAVFVVSWFLVFLFV